MLRQHTVYIDIQQKERQSQKFAAEIGKYIKSMKKSGPKIPFTLFLHASEYNTQLLAYINYFMSLIVLPTTRKSTLTKIRNLKLLLFKWHLSLLSNTILILFLILFSSPHPTPLLGSLVTRTRILSIHYQTLLPSQILP